MPSLFLRATKLAAVTLCSAVILLGQTNRGSIRGLVRDSSGAAVPGAQVECKNTGTSIAVQSVSSKDGEFIFPALNPGDYQVKVEAPGFRRAASETVRVFVGE